MTYDSLEFVREEPSSKKMNPSFRRKLTGATHKTRQLWCCISRCAVGRQSVNVRLRKSKLTQLVSFPSSEPHPKPSRLGSYERRPWFRHVPLESPSPSAQGHCRTAEVTGNPSVL